MANFISNTASAELTAATLDLSTGNYYAHLVTTVPLLTHSTAADLVLPTIGGYASTPLTGLSYNSTRWTFDSFSFPKYTLVSAPTGVAICKRAGSSPASTDRFICYSDFNNSIGQGISLQVGTYVVNLQFGTNGAINFTYRYQYNSGPYVNSSPVPPGLIYLVATKNNTLAYNANLIPVTAAEITDRSIGFVSVFNSRYACDFGSNVRVKPSLFGFEHRDSISKTIQLSGANQLTSFSFNSPDINNDFLWTQIGSLNNPITGWNFITVSSNDSWRYLRLKVSDNSSTLSVREIELYNSSALSSTINFL